MAEQGTLEPPDKEKVRALLTFDHRPEAVEIHERASALTQVALETGAEAAMLGGAPFLMSCLEACLRRAGIRPLYAFTRRESVTREIADGAVEKTAIFRHLGFVEPPVD